MPTYRIDRPGCDMPRVVVAALPQAARLHVANTELVVRKIEVDEAFELAGQGVTLERAGEEAPPLAEPEPDGPGLGEPLEPSNEEERQDEEGDGEFDDGADEGANNGGFGGEPAFYGEGN
jgi:hypothetical protein